MGAKSFQARLERDNTKLKWVIVRLPFDAATFWGKRGMIRVRGEINGFAFRTSLFPTGGGGHLLLVNKKMQAGGRVSAGEMAKFRLEPDTEKRLVVVPEELTRAISQDKALRRWYDKLNPSMRKYIADWIADVKSREARVRRAEQIAERLMATMDAERELPPVLRIAFGRDPRVMAGWKSMSVSRRRGHLMGIFHYRDPQSRARRIEKVVADAFAVGEKKAKN